MVSWLAWMGCPSLDAPPEPEPEAINEAPAPPGPPPGTTPPPETGATSGENDPSSDDLIVAALARGEVDAETALLYRVYAARGAAGLPAAYKGVDSSMFESSALLEARERFASLSPATRAAITPFLLRPSSQGSWLNPLEARTFAATADAGTPQCRGMDTNWTSDSVPTDKVKVWYNARVPGQRERAAMVQNAVQNEIWPRLIDELKFREPPRDARVACNGGDDRLDIELLPTCNNFGQAHDEYVQVDAATVLGGVFLEVCATQPEDLLRGTTAHELMHAIQWNYFSPRQDGDWVVESTATWAEDAVYGKTTQPEHRHASCYLSAVQNPMSNKLPCKNFYGAYLVHQYLASVDENAVRKLFEAMEPGVSGSKAFHTLKYDRYWWQYAKEIGRLATYGNLPEPHVRSTEWAFFPTEDDMRVPAHHLTTSSHMSLDLDSISGKHEFTELVPLGNLSIGLLYMRADRAETRSLLFHNPLYDATPIGAKVHVSALWRAEGEADWQEEFWTSYEWIGFCRDLKEQRVAELIIVVSNGEWDPATIPVIPPTPLAVHVSPEACLGYAGTVERVSRHGSWSGMGLRSHANLRFEILPQARDIAAMHPEIRDSLRAGLSSLMPIAGTDYSHQVNYTAGSCTSTFGPASFALAGLSPTTSGVLRTNPFPVLKDDTTGGLAKWFSGADGAYEGSAISLQRFVRQLTGPQSCPATQEDVVGTLFVTNLRDQPFPVASPDGTLKGTFSHLTDAYAWTLTPLRE